jgi:O-antigen ligase
MLSLPTDVLFVGWLFLAPIFQNSADASSLGRALTWVLYIAPALLFAGLTIARRQRTLHPQLVDWLPGAYVAYVVASSLLTSHVIESNPSGAGKAFFTIVVIGPVVYYFLTFGPGLLVAPVKIVTAILAAGLLQGVFAIVEALTHWNLWHFTGWQREFGGARATATLANPGVLGIFLGVAIIFAVAVLAWDGPRRLRLLSYAVNIVCWPAIVLTLTRGPIVATFCVVIALLLISRATRVLGIVLIAVGVLALAFLLPMIKSSDLYATRIAQRATLEQRAQVQHVSLERAKDKPVLGWGYGSFDRVKNASELAVLGLPVKSVLQTTSHDTYLTILVELGAIGLLLFAVPFLVLIWRGLAVNARSPDRWLVVGAIASLFAIYLNGSTLDYRFFSLALVLPFVLLAILRRESARVASSRLR